MFAVYFGICRYHLKSSNHNRVRLFGGVYGLFLGAIPLWVLGNLLGGNLYSILRIITVGAIFGFAIGWSISAILIPFLSPPISSRWQPLLGTAIVLFVIAKEVNFYLAEYFPQQVREAFRRPDVSTEDIESILRLVKTSPDNRPARFAFDGIAYNRNTPPEILRSMYQDPVLRRKTLRALASNPNTPKEILMELAKGNGTPNAALSLNPNLPKENTKTILERALRDLPSPRENMQSEEIDTIRGIIRNPQTPREIVFELTRHTDNRVRMVAQLELAKDPVTPVKYLANLVKADDSKVLRTLAANPTTPVSVLRQLADQARLDDDTSRRRGVLVALTENPNTPADVILKMETLPDEYDKKIARRGIQLRGLK
ncbi:MAG TPA: hypothetical protein VI895_05135 [Bdellovibrionota bacterium]|nr:hypothetical protein [Bdellovibrionota bacterium]